MAGIIDALHTASISLSRTAETYHRSGFRVEIRSVVGLSTLLDHQACAEHRSKYISERDCYLSELAKNKEITVFCKYSASKERDCYGHKKGVAYEADVYRHVLCGLKLPIPRFYGVYKDPEHDQIAIILEYLRDTARVSRVA